MSNKLEYNVLRERWEIEYNDDWFEENGKLFHTWFDPDLFEWRNCRYLAEYCSQYFEFWWDKDLYDYHESDALTRHCYDNIKTWWNADKYNWRYSGLLAIFCADNFDLWYHIKYYCEDDRSIHIYESATKVTHLVEHCIKDIDTWFDDASIYMHGESKLSILSNVMYE